jgi:hypothetical protein
MAVLLRRSWTGLMGLEKMEENSDKTVYHCQIADNIRRLVTDFI